MRHDQWVSEFCDDYNKRMRRLRELKDTDEAERVDKLKLKIDNLKGHLSSREVDSLRKGY